MQFDQDLEDKLEFLHKLLTPEGAAKLNKFEPQFRNLRKLISAYKEEISNLATLEDPFGETYIKILRTLRNKLLENDNGFKANNFEDITHFDGAIQITGDLIKGKSYYELIAYFNALIKFLFSDDRRKSPLEKTILYIVLVLLIPFLFQRALDSDKNINEINIIQDYQITYNQPDKTGKITLKDCETRIAKANVNLRSNPRLDSKVVYVLTKGDTVRILNERRRWMLISTLNSKNEYHIGWADKAYFK